MHSCVICVISHNLRGRLSLLIACSFEIADFFNGNGYLLFLCTIRYSEKCSLGILDPERSFNMFHMEYNI